MIRRLWPDTMLYQLLLLMVVAGTFMTLAGVVATLFVRQALDDNLSVMNSHLVSVAVAKLNETPADLRKAVLVDLQREAPGLNIKLVEESDLAAATDGERGRRFGPFRLGDTLLGMRIEHVLGPRELGKGAPPRLFIRLEDDSLVLAEWGFRGPPPPLLGLPFYLFAGFLALTFCVLLTWAARSLARPMAELAQSASNFGESGTEPVPVAEKGPREVRAAAAAFNRMQVRIDRFVEKRTRTLAAISHDLRTPLTRLRLRLDLLENGDIRDRSLEDLNIMDQQISAALGFLREGESSEPVLRIDVPSLLHALVDQYCDLGFPIELRCSGRFSINARRGELLRALSNLVDNARQYGDGAEIEAGVRDGKVQIDIVDYGPGIAEEERDRLLEPFERGDAARQIRQGTGFGLGLSTSKAIVEAASGKLDLLETQGGGLTVRMTLPMERERT
ncbi:signal transduction histidine kinase [Labrenzia sp. EL_208]|nr:signal transduction histidine kinase [Labrenzia sp. EL_132]MBG6228052.1 signal transduction histidine kinase [Labrenzia sp. EL_208]